MDDLLDHYEEYTDAEKAQVKEVFQKVAALNEILDKYDIETTDAWADYCTLVSKYFTAAQ